MRASIIVAPVPVDPSASVHSSRYLITVVEREKLEARVCECYAVVKREYERLLPSSRSSPSH